MYAKIIDDYILVFETCSMGHEVDVNFNVSDEQEFFKNIREGKDSSYTKVEAWASCSVKDCEEEMDWESGVKELGSILRNPIPEYPSIKLIRK